MRCDYAGMTTTAMVYAEFAARETHGISPSYERLSIAVSRDDERLCLLGRLPPANWPVIEEQMRSRATQTNEPGRCAVLLPVLAALPQRPGRPWSCSTHRCCTRCRGRGGRRSSRR
jgi:hypothetical protein